MKPGHLRGEPKPGTLAYEAQFALVRALIERGWSRAMLDAYLDTEIAEFSYDLFRLSWRPAA